MKYKHIIWDWNGTLVDDCKLCLDSFNISLKKRSLSSIDYQKYRSIFTFPIINVYKKAGFSFENESYEKISGEFVSFYENNFHKVKLHNQVRESLERIISKGLSQSILSAGRQDLLNNWLKSYDISEYFFKIVGVQDQYASGKLDQGLSLKKDLSFNDNEILLIGDTLHDHEVAESLNIDCILIDHGHVSTNRLERTGRIVTSSILGVLNSINI